MKQEVYGSDEDEHGPMIDNNSLTEDQHLDDMLHRPIAVIPPRNEDKVRSVPFTSTAFTPHNVD